MRCWITPVLPSALLQEQRSGFARGLEGSSTSGSCACTFLSDDVNSIRSLAVPLLSCSDTLDDMKEYPFLSAYPAVRWGQMRGTAWPCGCSCVPMPSAHTGGLVLCQLERINQESPCLGLGLTGFLVNSQQRSLPAGSD